MSLIGLDPAEFLANAWQKEPRLLRQALPGFESPLSADELAGLSLDEEVESRLISVVNGEWQLEHGPIPEERFTHTGDRDWTLLVQAVDLWVPEVQALIQHFDFLPRWRIDDVMVSFAAPGGGVGPHFDYYDVFLLQAEGEREWRLGQWCDASSPISVESGLKQLVDFEETGRFVLEPGDMLYVPPRLAHWGIATSPCLTFSVGFRAPTLAEMLEDLAVELMARGDDRFYRDPALTPAMANGPIDQAFVTAVQNQLRELAEDDELLEDWFARYMTSPKYPELGLDEDRTATTSSGQYADGERIDPDQ